jgi:hypothetical protein
MWAIKRSDNWEGAWWLGDGHEYRSPIFPTSYADVVARWDLDLGLQCTG